jgi:hypothetical protein
MFDVLLESGEGALVFTDRRGELVFRKPEGVAATVIFPQGRAGNFPSLLGFKPLAAEDRVPARDPGCSGTEDDECQRVFVLVS